MRIASKSVIGLVSSNGLERYKVFLLGFASYQLLAISPKPCFLLFLLAALVEQGPLPTLASLPAAALSEKLRADG
jgi:hypothetical protein